MSGNTTCSSLRRPAKLRCIRPSLAPNRTSLIFTKVRLKSPRLRAAHVLTIRLRIILHAHRILEGRITFIFIEIRIRLFVTHAIKEFLPPWLAHTLLSLIRSIMCRNALSKGKRLISHAPIFWELIIIASAVICSRHTKQPRYFCNMQTCNHKKCKSCNKNKNNHSKRFR